jgi:iron complex outermembrane recepter protein
MRAYTADMSTRFLPIVFLLTFSAAIIPATAPVYARQRAGDRPDTGRQGAAETALVVGSVKAPDGARLPGTVIVLSSDDRVVAQVVAGDQGVYRASNLRAGRYRVRATLDGFRPAEFDLDAVPGGTTTFDLTLQIASLSETVTVVGSADRESLEVPRIRESGARDVGEALAGLAGVWKVRRGGIGNDIVVRGYQGENVTVLIDGARLYGACPNNMDPAAFHVDFAEVDRIEIGKGPFDLKNQGGLGAAVNIVTKRPPAGAHASAQFSAGSFGYVNPSATASYGNGRTAILGGYSTRRGDPYQDGDGRSMLATANYKTSGTLPRAFDANTAWMRSDLSAGTSHAFQVGATRQRANTVLYPYLQMDAGYDDADRVNVGYDYRRHAGVVQAVRATAYGTRVEHWMTDEFRLTSIGMSRAYSMATIAKTATVGGKAEAAFPGGTAGVEFYRREWNAETQLAMMKYQAQYSIPGVALTSVGAFVEYSHPLTGAVTLDVGGRVDSSRSVADGAKASTALYTAYHGRAQTVAADVYPSGKIRLAYKPAENLTISGGVGHTVRVPDPQERYFGLRRSGSDWVGNPFLAPTANTGLEVGASWRTGVVFLNAVAHRDSLTNAIAVYQQARVAAVPGVTNPVARSYRNVDGTMTGAEFEAVVSLTDTLFAAADVSYVRGRQAVNAAAGVNSPWFSEMPPTRSRAALRYERRLAHGSAFVEVEETYSAGQNHVDTDVRESPTPAYALLNVRAGASRGPFRVSFGLSNLLDRTYVESLSYQRDPFRTGSKVYEPGRNVYVNVAIVFREANSKPTRGR